MTSPAPDVWPSILTDYTYDSELDNADGVPHSVSTQLDVPGGEQLFYILNIMKYIKVYCICFLYIYIIVNILKYLNILQYISNIIK